MKTITNAIAVMPEAGKGTTTRSLAAAMALRVEMAFGVNMAALRG